MSSPVQADVIDLAGSPSPVRSPPPPRGQRTARRQRRHRNNGASGIINVDQWNNSAAGNNHAGSASGAAAMPEIINLEDSPPRGQLSANRNRGTSASESPTKRRRRRRHAAAAALTFDDDVVEIISPPRAAAAAATSLKPSPTQNKQCVERIREVFPLVSRARVEEFFTTANSYLADNEGAFQTVMAVLSEDPTGTSVTDATFAAAAVGRAGRGSGKKSPAGKGKGRRKVAQLECQCCFVEHPFEEMVSCRTGGHLFCTQCLQKHTETRVFGVGNFGVKPNGGGNGKQAAKALEILCMAGECTSGFHEGQLRKALSDKVLKKYNELQYAAVIEQAGMKDVFKCPKCEFMAVADGALPPQLFHCPQCNFKSCKDCGEEYHPNIRCDQVESKTEAAGRTKVEDAMTEAMVRRCPRPMCRKIFLKDDGCNKMTCSCGAFICYVCRKEIPKAVAYKHFCQTPFCNHQSCNKCPLYADTTEQDKVRMRNAGKKAARSMRKHGVRVDVEGMLKDPPPGPAQFGRKR
ncbi:hypothetical protein ACHAXT_008920 [Thalassiosira profunda]